MSRILFENLKHQKEVTLSCFHWTSEQLSLKDISNKPFSFCDNSNTWAGEKLVEVIVHLAKPYVILNCDKTYQVSDKFMDRLLDAGFDSLIYTPSSQTDSLRQGLLLKPKQQILFLKDADYGNSMKIKHSYK